MDLESKRNYANKIKILTRQIQAILELVPQTSSFREKLKYLPPRAQERIHFLLELRQQLKKQLKTGEEISLRTTTFRIAHVSFFSRLISPLTNAQKTLIERLQHDQQTQENKSKKTLFKATFRDKSKP
ncbi:MAG: hypothetical protein HY939_07615 [Gammaproteobacteria bacterium]|nr:hypothetical protein [Gammaproteobacteria bacterium]